MNTSRNLDVTAPTASVGGLSMGKVCLDTVVRAGRPVPQGFKRYDFLATGGALSAAEAKLLVGHRGK